MVEPMNPTVMFVILITMLGVFAWSSARRLAALAAAQPEARFGIEGDAFGQRLRNTLVYAFGQKKMPYYPWAGIAHIFIFQGFALLLLRVLMLWGRGFSPEFDFFGVLSLSNPIGITYNIVKEAFGVLVIAGCSVFFYYRLVDKQARMTLGTEGLVILGLITVMML
ncbi:MAG: hypothetical protein RL701_2998, partial [Pseudomonadota bacterium]